MSADPPSSSPALSHPKDHAHLLPQGDGPAESSADLLRRLYLGVWSVIGADVQGDIAEFGTQTGLTARALAKSLAQNHVPGRRAKRLLLFDSFEGLPPVTAEADADAPHLRLGHWHPGLCRGASADELRALVTAYLPTERVDIYEGWFADTAARLPDDTRLALIHVDCDYYQSTLDALRPCFARGLVAEGAHLFFDDWNCNRASRAFGERKAWAELAARFGVDYSDGGDYAAFGHKLIVHGYAGMPPERDERPN